ncbi:uncharacterized protein JCM15063_001996 [Sporobolomyces koalae]|uniref:uncharacterized protein n=1 Tax=Sporobolomyces koalae TaxID=500713 RepID=UPI0031785F96
MPHSGNLSDNELMAKAIQQAPLSRSNSGSQASPPTGEESDDTIRIPYPTSPEPAQWFKTPLPKSPHQGHVNAANHNKAQERAPSQWYQTDKTETRRKNQVRVFKQNQPAQERTMRDSVFDAGQRDVNEPPPKVRTDTVLKQDRFEQRTSRQDPYKQGLPSMTYTPRKQGGIHHIENDAGSAPSSRRRRPSCC